MFEKSPMQGATARREKARQEMHGAIMRVASRLVQEKGVNAVTIRGIASELGYSPGAIYEYYESKEDILKHVFFEGTGGLADIMAAAIENGGADARASSVILNLARSYRQAALANPEMFRLVMGAIKCPPAELVLSRAQDLPSSLTLVMETVERGMQSGEFRQLNPVAALAAAWSLVQGFVSLESTGHLDVVDLTVLRAEQIGPTDRDELFEGVLQIMLQGMLAHPEQAN